ncbi:hypothetical protein [Oerskovia flava]|uniref:hypothetical protein n=1 Tax=Oerskovia flava TaxID=2986422 RepID=UPI00223F7E73|nr:hypothetical protein [Oerskovia sp. JB1-3-2]
MTSTHRPGLRAVAVPPALPDPETDDATPLPATSALPARLFVRAVAGRRARRRRPSA